MVFGIIGIIMIQLVCVIGIVTNVLVIYTVSHKSNQKELKENQYKYMRLHAIISCIIFSIQVFSLTTECQTYDSILCSSIHHLGFFQFFRIIFQEYIWNCLCLASNMVYVGFAINRLSLIGKNHSKFVVKISKLKIGSFICRVFIPCLILPVVKIFRVHPNFDNPDDIYPTPFISLISSISPSVIFLYFAFNLLCDLVNYVVFLIVNLILDIKLVLKLKETINEKQQNKSRAKKTNKNEEK